MTKILAISDIDWKHYKSLLQLLDNVEPDLLIISGDICQFGLPKDSGDKLWNKLVKQNIMTLIVKGNWDDGLQIKKNIHPCGYSSIRDISDQYFRYNGLTFLGIPYNSFEPLRNARDLVSKYSGKVDVIIAHPSTARRIWTFDLNPKIVIMGHDDLRICKVLNSLLISTNFSPINYAVLKIDKKQVMINYHQYQHPNRSFMYSSERKKHSSPSSFNGKMHEGYLRYSAKWVFENKSLTWLSEEHYCYHPPYCYPPKDKDYGNMLGTLIKIKRTKTKDEILEMLPKLIQLNVPKILLKEYLGIPDKVLHLTRISSGTL